MSENEQKRKRCDDHSTMNCMVPDRLYRKEDGIYMGELLKDQAIERLEVLPAAQSDKINKCLPSLTNY